MKEVRRSDIFRHLDVAYSEFFAIQYEYAASVWAVIDHFGGILITEELNGPNIHRLENVLTMGIDLHTRFDNLLIWLEEDSVGWMVKLRQGDK